MRTDTEYIKRDIKRCVISIEAMLDQIDDIDTIGEDEVLEIEGHFAQCFKDLIYLYGLQETNKREKEIFTEDVKKKIEEL